jgi:ketol-acid reductoisomerase
MKMFRKADVDPKALSSARIAVIGYGSQGRAQACNLRDSGLNVVLGLRTSGTTASAARAEGWEPREIEDAVREADLVALLIPDTAQPKVFREQIAPHLRPGSVLLFSHGFNVHYKTISVPEGVDIAMVAPKAPGALLRRQFVAGQGVPCLLAVERDATGTAQARALAYADGIGGTRAGVLETNFAEETETDLFGEQAVLCGGMTELVLAGFETLTEAGYQPEVAYFECLHELKLIVDLLYEGGMAKVHQFVSDTAKYGDLSRGPRIIDDHVRAKMREVLAEVRSGAFAREWIAEDAAGRPRYRALLKKDLEHSIESVGRKLRADMSWLETRPSSATGVEAADQKTEATAP